MFSVVDGRIDIPSEDVDVDALVALIQSGEVSYPYRRYYLPPPEVLYEDLKRQPVAQEQRALTPFDLQTEGMPLPVLVDVYTTGEGGEALTDWYTEPQRAKGTVANGVMSLLQLWHQMTREVVLRCITEYDRVNVSTLRNSLRSIGRYVRGVTPDGQHFRLAPETNNFSNSHARNIYERYCPQGGVVIDPSSGWGDRMLGAGASGVVSKYIAVDPNEELYEGYSQIRQLVTHMRIVVLSMGAQEIPLTEPESVDMAFTSPPYWDLETYTKASTQSISLFDSYEQWMSGFMFESLERVYYRLRKGAPYLIHIRDIRGRRLVEPIDQKLRSLGAVYEGVIAIVTSSTTAPVWVWRKPV